MTDYRDNIRYMSILPPKKHDSLWRQYKMYVYITAKETWQPMETI